MKCHPFHFLTAYKTFTCVSRCPLPQQKKAGHANYQAMIFNNVNSDAGFTLVELVISMVIIGVALAGTLTAINMVTRYSADPMILQQSAAIAESYLAEIASKAFPPALPCSGTEPAGGRVNYATVCDYKFIPVSGQVPTDQMGNPVAGLSRYTVRVTIDDGAATLQGLTATAGQVIRADVIVSHPQLGSTTYSVYRTNY